jgi:hypothetical protein
MTAARPKSKTIDLKDLLAPRVQDIITKGSVFKDPQYSLYHTAREAIGWQNWMRERQLPMTGSPMEVVREAARSLRLSSIDVDQAIAKANQENCVPSAKFMDKGGDVSCWMRVADLNGWLFKARCPTDIQLEALERMSQHRALNPELAAQRENLQRQKQAAPTPEAIPQTETISTEAAQPASRQIPVEQSANVPQIEFETVGAPTPQHHLNTRFAQMGRQLVAEVGAEQDGQRSLSSEIGRAQYKIVLNLANNTMRIYAHGRGTEPILVDANGNIDHANARILPGDLEAFQTALDYLQKHRQPNTGVER